MASPTPTTSLCRYTDTDIFYRDRNLIDDLLQGNADFISVMTRHILGRDMSAAQIRIMHAILITMLEHGLTPSAIATRYITINATGATAALLGDMGIPVRLMRGFAVISRAAGLFAHITEEQRKPSGRTIWSVVDKAIPFEDEPAP